MTGEITEMMQDKQWTLFGNPPENLKKRQTRRSVPNLPVTQDSWHLEPHVCSVCFGRVGSRVLPSGVTIYRCTNCGHEAAGLDTSVICACGIKMHSSSEGKRIGPAVRDAGIRCHANPKRSPEFPSEFVASYVDPRERK